MQLPLLLGNFWRLVLPKREPFLLKVLGLMAVYFLVNFSNKPLFFFVDSSTLVIEANQASLADKTAKFESNSIER